MCSCGVQFRLIRRALSGLRVPEGTPAGGGTRRYCVSRSSPSRPPFAPRGGPLKSGGGLPEGLTSQSIVRRSACVSVRALRLTMFQSAFSSHSSTHQPADAVDNQTLPNPLHHVDVPTKKATFAMACFWAPDALFGSTPGVIKTKVGYCGGTKENPEYRNLGDHTEALEVDYDPNQITYEKLLELFWANHDPTARLKLQYTSFVFYHDEEQKEVAEKTFKEQEAQHRKPLVTVVRPAVKFYDAEDYHQKFRLQQHPWLCELLSVKDNGQLLKDSFVSARLNGYVIGCGGVEQFEKEWQTLGLDQKAANYVKRLVAKYEGQGLVC